MNSTDSKNKEWAPHISVLMSVYNGEKYLKEAVESILGQTFTDFELIIVNDASTDNTDAILHEVAKADSRIILIKNEANLGLTKSLNIGLKQARGEYVARMDTDDISLPERFELQKKFLDENPSIVAVGGENEIIDTDGKKTGYKKVYTGPALLHFLFIIGNQINHSSIMFRKKPILDEGGYDEHFRYVQDFELWSRLSKKKFLFSNLTTPLLQYRLHSNSITQAKPTRDVAYEFVREVIHRNVSEYVSNTKNANLTRDIDLFLHSFHKQQVASFIDTLRIISFLYTFTGSYIKKENPDNAVRSCVYNFRKHEARKALQWYVKARFKKLKSKRPDY
jgi:glycosyltransferase involved in cell wall biosynthesis